MLFEKITIQPVIITIFNFEAHSKNINKQIKMIHKFVYFEFNNDSLYIM